MEDREFFSNQDVFVSLTRFVAFGQTYAMSGVTSVKAAEIKPDHGGTIVLAFIAFVCLIFGTVSVLMLAIGLSLAVWAAITGFSKEPSYSVMLTVSSGQVQAVTSKDRELISKIVQALNDCIVARG